MEEELARQEQEKKTIEARLREKLRRQQLEEETKIPAPQEEFNDAPSYYQPTIIPQAPLTLD
jgi:hypothetical protein